MITKKIALFGIDAKLVERVAVKALERGHCVTAIVPQPDEIKLRHHKLKTKQGNMMNHNEVSCYAYGHDVVICLHEPDLYHPERHIKANKAVIEGAKNAGIQRIISLGHPVSARPEKTKAFYDLWKAMSEAQRETHKLFKNEDWLRWEYLRSHHIVEDAEHDKKHGHHTVMVNNPEGVSKTIHAHSFIDALLEEAEKTEFIWHEGELVF